MRTSLVALMGVAGFLGGCVVESSPTYLNTYEPCAFSSDCQPGDQCVDITVTNPSGRTVTDGLCTHSCIDDGDCPVSYSGLIGACYEVGGASALCYERCDFDSDCPVGYGCYPTTGVPDAICLPI